MIHQLNINKINLFGAIASSFFEIKKTDEDERGREKGESVPDEG